MTRPAVGAGLLWGKEMDFFSPFLFPSSTYLGNFMSIIGNRKNKIEMFTLWNFLLLVGHHASL
jgi:hypothetical protein